MTPVNPNPPLLAAVEGTPLSPENLPPLLLPESSDTPRSSVDLDVTSQASSDSRLAEVGQLHSACGMRLAAGVGMVGMALSGTGVLASEALLAGAAALGVVATATGAAAGGAVGLLVALVPAVMLASCAMGGPIDRGSEEFMRDFARLTVGFGALAGGAVVGVAAALVCLSVSWPYIAFRQLYIASQKLVESGGVSSEKLNTLKNFVLFIETVATGKKFIEKKRTSVPTDPIIQTFQSRIGSHGSLKENPFDGSMEDNVLNWLGRGGIGSRQWVAVVKKEDKIQYISARVLRKEFGFSRREAQYCSNLKPDEAIEKVAEIAATKETKRQALIEEMQTFIKSSSESGELDFKKCDRLLKKIQSKGFSIDSFVNEVDSIVNEGTNELPPEGKAMRLVIKLYVYRQTHDGSHHRLLFYRLFKCYQTAQESGCLPEFHKNMLKTRKFAIPTTMGDVDIVPIANEIYVGNDSNRLRMCCSEWEYDAASSLASLLKKQNDEAV